MSTRHAFLSLFATLATVLGSCSRAAAPQQQGGGVSLVTDSSEYTVRLVNGLYRATIGYVYANRSDQTVSANQCGSPTPPVLEKKVGEGWVVAYSPFVLACRSHPPFWIEGGTTYRSALHMSAGRRGDHVMPFLDVDSVPGIYRLRSALRAGSDPDAPGAAAVEVISNEFRLVER